MISKGRGEDVYNDIKDLRNKWLNTGEVTLVAERVIPSHSLFQNPSKLPKDLVAPITKIFEMDDLENYLK